MTSDCHLAIALTFMAPGRKRQTRAWPIAPSRLPELQRSDLCLYSQVPAVLDFASLHSKERG